MQPSKKRKEHPDGIAHESAEQTAASMSAKAAEKFKLREVPQEWLARSAVKNLAENTAKWKSYMHQRKNLAHQRAGEDAEAVDDDEGAEDREFRLKLKKKASAVLAAAGIESSLKTSLVRGTDIWPSCEPDDLALRDADITVSCFSPFQLPSGIQIRTQYHHRTRYYSIEYYLHVDWRTLPLDKGSDLLGEEKEGWEPMFSATFMEAPPLGNEQAELHNFSRVLNLDAAGCTVETVREIRDAIFGPTSLSLPLISDHALITYLLTCAGVLKTSGELDLGYSWDPSDLTEEMRERMTEEGIDVESDANQISWWASWRKSGRYLTLTDDPCQDRPRGSQSNRRAHPARSLLQTV